MGNTINYADVFNRILDEKYAILSRTSMLENNSLGIVWEGGRNVKIPKLSTQGLGTVSGCEVPGGDLTFAYESKSLQWDRGRTFQIPRYAVNETNFALNVANVIATFSKDSVIPEADKLRLSTIASAAITATNAVYEGSTVSSTPVADLLNDIQLVQDKIGEDKQLVIFISLPKKTALMKSAEISKYIAVREPGNGVNARMDLFNDFPLIGVPSSYMKSAFTLYDGTTSGQEAGGVVAADSAKTVNWLIVAKDSAIAVGYPRVEKVISPDENQSGDCWKIMFHYYHGLFVLDNKLDGIMANLAGAAPTTAVRK